MSDRELGGLEAYSQSLKKRRDEERKQKAMDEARAIFTAAGLDFKDVAGKNRKGSKKPSIIRKRKGIECHAEPFQPQRTMSSFPAYNR